MRRLPIPAETEAVASSVIDAALAVHRELGPGLLESAYEGALVIELRSRGHAIRRQSLVRARYRGLPIDGGFRLDLLVDDRVIVELKTVERIREIHIAQVLTYLRLSRLRLGLLLNFHVVLLRDGVRRVVL